MLAEVLDHLAIRPDGRYIDCTFGRGGHARAVLEQLSPEGRLFGIDRDPEAVSAGRALATADPRFTMLAGRHEELRELMAAAGAGQDFDGISFDLGLSSPQIDDPARGFSFSTEGPLDMRMDPTRGESAADWLNRADERDIADTIYQFGEERLSRRIARAIVAARPLRTTTELADLVRRQYPRRHHRIHPATRTFQALRIRVNDELRGLADALEQALTLLRLGGRLVVISFHSLEDRIVKQFMRANRGTRLGIVERIARPGEAETAINPRARSARLRVAERLA